MFGSTRGSPITATMPGVMKATKYIELLCPYDSDAMLMGESAMPTNMLQRKYGRDVFDFCLADDLEAVAAIIGLSNITDSKAGMVEVAQAFLAADGKTLEVWDRLLYFVVNPPYFGLEDDASPEMQAIDLNQDRSFSTPEAAPVYSSDVFNEILMEGILPLLMALLNNATCRKKMFATANAEYLKLLKPQLALYAGLLPRQVKPAFDTVCRLIQEAMTPNAENGEFCTFWYLLVPHILYII
jgi:hypothetical protein